MSMVHDAQVFESTRVRIRSWHTRDDATQRRWPPYHDLGSQLWNIPRPTTLPGGLFALSGGMRQAWAVEDQCFTLIGRISLREMDQRRKRARLGITLGAPFVGQGLGTEALGLFLHYFFTTLGYQTMVLDVAAFNRRAVRSYEQLGFACLSSEWRRGNTYSCTRLLEAPDYRHLACYFYRDHTQYWVQFLEMELTRAAWLAHRDRAPYPPLESVA